MKQSACVRDVVWNGKINGAFVIVPFQMEATENCAVAVNRYVIVFFESVD